MHSFNKNFLLSDLRFEAHFDQYYAPNGIRYLVNVRDRTGDSYYFNMEKQTDKWRIVNSPVVSELFLNNENKFSEAIIEHHNKS